MSGAWLFEGAVKSGLIKATADGRYYLDPEQDRRRRRWYWASVVGVAALSVPAAVLALT